MRKGHCDVEVFQRDTSQLILALGVRACVERWSTEVLTNMLFSGGQPSGGGGRGKPLLFCEGKACSAAITLPICCLTVNASNCYFEKSHVPDPS
jgi:hypothetical protein